MKILFDYNLLNEKDWEFGVLEVDLSIKANGEKMQELLDCTDSIKHAICKMLNLNELEEYAMTGMHKDNTIFSLDLRLREEQK